MKTRLFIVFSALPLFSFAGDSTATFPLNKYGAIFNAVFLTQKTQYGIFDSTDSWFVVYQDTAFQSPFDSQCIRAAGKTWHRKQSMRCMNYITVNDVTPVL